jgi:hypothetical protein
VGVFVQIGHASFQYGELCEGCVLERPWHLSF